MEVVLIFSRISSGILRAFTSDDDLAACFFLELLLIVTFRADQDACIVKVTVFGKDDFPLDFRGVADHREHACVQTHREATSSLDHGQTDSQIFVGWVEFFHEGGF
jgi:hypothetical protein